MKKGRPQAEKENLWNLWVVTADRAGARIFEWSTRGEHLKLVQEIDHPQGRLRNQDFDSDRMARMRSVAHFQYSSTSHEETPVERHAVIFVKKLCGILKEADQRRRYDEMILSAAPHVLGLLRRNLPHSVREKISCALSKDLNHMDLRDLEIYLKTHVTL